MINKLAMTIKNFVALLFLFLLISGKPVDQYPQAEITNGLIRARLYLPDSQNGFYRGARFDWAGVIPELVYKGHTFFGKWYSQEHDPAFHDHIAGPVEEFTVVGYDEAKVGETFLKIGVGMLVKPEEANYFFVTPYKNINSGTWKVKKKKDQVEFSQTLNDNKYSYEYKKTVQLVKDNPELELLHSLKNTGKLPIETNVYNHNFFVLDNQPIGPDYEVTFPFPLTSETPDNSPLGKLQSNKIQYDKILVNNSDHLFYRSITGFGKSASDYDIKIENHKSGAGVRITGDQPLSKIVFWSAPKTICPEPYIRLTIQPGETVEWKITYQFYSL
jgi:hypothetical protein